jgi:hypothetical protein
MASTIPLWLKVAHTAFTAVTIAIYAKKYPLWNFLWVSDIALIVTAPALWLESSLLASMMLVSVLLVEVVLWNAPFFVRLVTGYRAFGLTDYMFDASNPRYLRAISLVFHVALPPLLLWMVHRLGYDPRALLAQTALIWVVLPLSYWFGNPKEDNLNWVFGWTSQPQTLMPPVVYLGVMMAAYPLLVYLPTHLLLQWVFFVAGPDSS